MAELFFTYLRISFFAGIMILAVLLARPFLRKAPRNISCLLWLLVALRLLLPFQLESPLSLQPRQFSEPAPITNVTEIVPLPEQEPVTDLSPVQPQETPPMIEDSGLEPETVFAIIWIAGSLSVILYATVSYGVLRYRVRDAVWCPDGAWESDQIGGAFLLGYFKPQIYIPTGLTDQDRNFILAHERSHQKRGDHWWKLLGMICLSVHWYNPLVWLSYALLCRDIEVACDERVIRSMVLDERKSYSLALLNSGKRLSGFLAYPVAFGEISLKERIKTVLSYRKPTVWITVAAITITLAVAVCFMTNPKVEAAVIYEETVQTTEPTTAEPTAPTTESTVPTETLPPETTPTEPATLPTEPATVPPETTESAPMPTEPTPTKPAPTQPKPTTPTKPAPTPMEPTTPTKPSVAPTEPKPEPTQPPVTTPTEPEVTEPPTTAPTLPPVTEPTPSAPEQETIGGSCGENVVWEYSESSKCLAIRGAGPMDTGTEAPWKSFGSEILSLTIDNGITAISPYAFSDCTGIYNISIPGSVATIGKCAFYECKKLRTVRLSEGLRTIGVDAFEGTGIRTIIIPKTVIQIETGAFSECRSLARITFTGAPPSFGQSAFLWTTATAYYPEKTGTWLYATGDYGGDITWELSCTNHSYISGVCERCGIKKGA